MKSSKILSIAIGLITLVLLFAYAHWVEPNWIETTRHIFPAPIKKTLKIAHLSDLHIRSIGERESKILSLLNAETPDFILITGDSVAENGNYNAVMDFLGKLSAPLGVWQVKGNWEHWRPDPTHRKYPNGLRLLDNSASEVQEGLWLVGIDDELGGEPDLEKSLRKVPDDAFTIGLIHSPSYFDRSSQAFDLVLAGHTHGGQVRLPFLPPLWLPEGSGPYVSGWYKNGNSRMFVSRGLGNSILDLRFFCRPELAIIELVPQ